MLITKDLILLEISDELMTSIQQVHTFIEGHYLKKENYLLRMRCTQLPIVENVFDSLIQKHGIDYSTFLYDFHENK